MCCFSAKYTHHGVKPKTGWLGIRIMCQNGATCLSSDYCFDISWRVTFGELMIYHGESYIWRVDDVIRFCCFSAKYTHHGVKPKTGWLGIRIMCQNGATCLSSDYCFSELALEKRYNYIIKVSGEH
jgi:hypothetical protein